MYESRRAKHIQDTRDALIGAARQLFTENGYANVGTEEIVQKAGLTRGAMYHHFRGKADLFLAVVEEVSAEVLRTGQDHPAGISDDPWQEYRQRSDAFLDAATRNAAYRRVVLIDSPAVLGWRSWSERRDGSFMAVERWIRRAIAAGALEDQPVAPLAELLIASGNQAVMYIAHASDPQTARREMGESLNRILEGLRRR